jgi:hypothetical protein
LDFYQGVVVDYLRANRTTFVNTEYCIQINSGDNPDTSGPHWYCDAVAMEFQSKTIFLCEISFAKHLDSLSKRLKHWNEHWDGLRTALERDAAIAEVAKTWPIRPWLFVPKDVLPRLEKVLGEIDGGNPPRFFPRITPLEMVQPWRYCSWNRRSEGDKPDVPDQYR